MRTWSAEQVAQAAGARLLTPPPLAEGPARAVIDSRGAGPGALFVGLQGRNHDGGSFARQALSAGAWGVLTTPPHARAAESAGRGGVLAAEDPLRALQRLATAWRRELPAKVIGVTGSTGKTSTKDLLLAVLTPTRRAFASRANFNTEIGLPLEILQAPADTEVLVLEMAMRGTGQIAQLAAIAEPDVAVIVSVGPVHLELLGTLEAVAAAKSELIAALSPGATAVVPAGEKLLARHLRDDITTITFGEHGDVRLLAAHEHRLEIDLRGEPVELQVSFAQEHLRTNLLAAVAAAHAVGTNAQGRVELALSPGRGRRSTNPAGITVIDDCYNANPMSMRAALQDLAATAGRERAARRVAVLGDMLELGAQQRAYHLAVGEQCAAVGVDLLVTVGPLAQAIADGYGRAAETHATADAAAAAGLLPGLVGPRDVVLVKGSRRVGLEQVCRALGVGAS
jgi:UDP-N-acetylmuramoyl-tripeptide--D-alanyl-D-alanine ligase